VSAPRREYRVRRQVRYQGRVVELYRDRVRDARGGRHWREVIGHRPAVAVVPLLAPDRILLIRQYRYAVGRFLWELPAGLVEPGESPVAAARRELEEETGYQAKNLHLACSIYSSPGFSQEVIHIFIGQGLARVGKTRLDPDEFISAKVWSLPAALARLQQGSAQDGKTLLGVQLALEKLKKRKTGL
jgi:ADP-ribose pyrophosphatase